MALNGNETNENNNHFKNGIKHFEEKWEKPLPAKKSLIFDNVCHYPAESVFTKLSENLQLDGFKNFIFLILVISVGRLMFENLSMYGFAANPLRVLSYVVEFGLTKLTLTYVVSLFFFTMASLFLEQSYVTFLKAQQKVARHRNGTSTFDVNAVMERNFTFVYMTLLLSMLAFPVVLNYVLPGNPYLMSVVCLLYAATFLKLYSYHATNGWWRTGIMYGQPLEAMRNVKRLEEKMEQYMDDLQKLDGDSQIIFYPQNLTVSNMIYYILAPTLCYQINYPRTNKINWYFVIRCLLETIFTLELQIVLAEQWIFVPLSSQLFTFSQLTVSQFVLIWTKMSLATISIWLLMFYSLFQSQANLLAELLRFADRDFYGDWWCVQFNNKFFKGNHYNKIYFFRNATSLNGFWKDWNKVVHRFLVRHLFKPLLIEGGYSVTTASTFVFFVSGLFHEYFVSPPLGMFCFHFILGMTLQQPLDMATKNIHKTSRRLANMAVWFSLCLGQSLLLLQYYNDIIIRMRVQAAEEAAQLMI